MLPTIVTVNPFMAKRKHSASKNRSARRAHYHASNPFHGRKHHRRHKHRSHRRVINPFKGGFLPSTQELVGVGAGAAGAVLTDIAMAYLPVPASLQTGWMNLLTRAAVAIAVGGVTGMVASKRMGQAVGAGGLIVVAYSGLKQALAPTLGTTVKGLSGLADFGDYRPSYGMESSMMQGAGMGAYMQPRLGAYMQRGLGAYMNPAPFLASPASASPIVAKQRAMAGFGGFGGYDSESM